MNHTPSYFPLSPESVRRQQSGFTMIELMVAIVISLIMLTALVALLVNMNRNNNEMAKSNSQIENGRFAIQLLQSDLQQAGFWGPYVPHFDDVSSTTAPTAAELPQTVPDPCLAYSSASWDDAYKISLIGIGVQSYDVVPSGCSTSLISHKKDNTDVLVVRHASNCVPGETNCEAETAGKLYFQASQCDTEISASTPYVLGTTGFTLRTRTCATTLADKRKFISNIYYIRDYANSVGDGIPTLVRSEFDLSGGTVTAQTPVPLIEGIESFKVELGIDSQSGCGTAVNYLQAVSLVNPTTCATDTVTPANNTLPNNRGDGVPEGSYVRCTGSTSCTAVQLMDVVAVKIYLLARNQDTTTGYTDAKTYTMGSSTLGPFNDHYKRHVFSTMVRLTNISGRRGT